MKKTLLITYFFPPQLGGIQNYYLNFCQAIEPDKLAVLTQGSFSPPFHPSRLGLSEAEGGEKGRLPGLSATPPSFQDTPPWKEGETEFDKNQKYHIYRADFFGGHWPPKWRQLKDEIQQIIRTEGIEQIIFGHFHPFNLFGLELGLPYFVFGHGTDIRQVGQSWWQRRAFKKVYAGAAGLIVNSEYLARIVEGLTGERQKVSVVFPGVNLAKINQPAADFNEKKKALGLDDNDIVMLSVGRAVAEKNFAAVIRLMPELLNLIPNLKYLIVGDGPELENLKYLASQLDLDYQVKFIGAVENTEIAKSFYYQLSHLFITVSQRPEGFGIGYGEAQAAGLPVVASKFGGSAEAVIDGQTGILVDPNDQREIVNAIYRLLSDQELWQKYSDAARKRAAELDWPRQMEKIKMIINY